MGLERWLKIWALVTLKEELSSLGRKGTWQHTKCNVVKKCKLGPVQGDNWVGTNWTVSYENPATWVHPSWPRGSQVQCCASVSPARLCQVEARFRAPAAGMEDPAPKQSGRREQTHTKVVLRLHMHSLCPDHTAGWCWADGRAVAGEDDVCLSQTV